MTSSPLTIGVVTVGGGYPRRTAGKVAFGGAFGGLIWPEQSREQMFVSARGALPRAGTILETTLAPLKEAMNPICLVNPRGRVLEAVRATGIGFGDVT